MKNKLLLIIALICIVVPFITLGAVASAETFVSDGVQYDFHVFHGSYVGDPSVNYMDESNLYFSFFRTNMNALSDAVWVNLPVLDYDFSLNDSPVFTFRGTYAMFTPISMSGGGITIASSDGAPSDGLLHSYCLIFAVYADYDGDLLDYFLFNGSSLYDVAHLTPLPDTYVADDGVYVSGSSNSVTNTGDYPNVSYNMFLNYDTVEIQQFSQAYDFYALTWYGPPTAYYTFEYYTNTFSLSTPFIFAFFDSTSDNPGYNQGYEAGVNVGKEQGYNDGFTAGIQQGYNDGVTAGKIQANNTVNQGSASYIQGYQDGLSAPEYSFMSLISALFDAPIRAFFGYTENGVTHPGLFSIDILGMNMGAFIASIFSLAVIITIIRLILGGKT